MRRLIVALAALVAVLATARLGVWQLDRAAQKTAAQALIDERARLPPLRPSELALSTADAQAQLQRTITVQGRWQHERTVFLDNRPLEGRAGFYVTTPLLLDDGTAVVVQRGWAPRDAADRTRLPSLPQAAGRITVTGRVAPWPSHLLAFDRQESGPIRQNLDADAFGRETGLRLRPVVVLQTGDAGDGLRREWPRPALDVDRNYGYAFQWFSLAALIAGLYVWFQLVKPRLHRA